MSDRKLDCVLFADLELTCWDGPAPAGEEPEIIEIGVVELDLVAFRIRRLFQRLIKPVRSRISPFCTELTGIRPKDAKAGRAYDEVARSLRKAFGNAPWMAWGADGEALAAEAGKRQMPILLPGPVSDFSLFYNQLAGGGRKFSLREAMEREGLSFICRQHTALADAFNTARIFAALAARARGIAGGNDLVLLTEAQLLEINATRHESATL